MFSDPSSSIQQCLDRLRAGDSAARDDLLRACRERLLVMTRRMLKRYPGVRRWEETDDVLQNALVRLDRGLSRLALDSPADFLRLAAAQIRWELIDLARHYFGPEGLAAHHATPQGQQSRALPEAATEAERSDDPDHLVRWGEVHERVAGLPDAERGVFDLLWYHGMSQVEAAAVLSVSVRTVKRRWQSARLLLADALDVEPPS
jgi:RNA polymerase sigma factor (sigma-70 family)